MYSDSELDGSFTTTVDGMVKTARRPDESPTESDSEVKTQPDRLSNIFFLSEFSRDFFLYVYDYHCVYFFN